MLELHEEAQAAAQKAVDEAIQKYGENNSAFLYCGFAWAVIKPARGPFVTALKRAGVGSSGTYGGWRISAYDMFNLPPKLSQSMELKEIGVRAYCDALKQHNIPISSHSRAD
jgi:hypothetical protein